MDTTAVAVYMHEHKKKPVICPSINLCSKGTKERSLNFRIANIVKNLQMRKEYATFFLSTCRKVQLYRHC